MIFIDTALGSASAWIRYAAVEVSAKLCTLLPGDILTENLSSLIIGLIPILEAEFLTITNEVEEAAVYLTGWGDIFKGNHYNPNIIFHDDKKEVSPDLTQLLNTAYAKGVNERMIKQAKDLAISIFRKLLVERSNQIVGYIPDIPELTDIRSSQLKKYSDLSFDDSLILLRPMLKHESSDVRSVALKRLFSLCKDNLNQLYCMEDSNGSYVIPEIISDVLQELLQLSSLETNEEVNLMCAKCFGLFGAIDPERFKTKIATSKKENKSYKEESIQFSPWNLESESFGVHLLEHHLIPGLQSTSINWKSQDKAGFAIQEILKQLSKRSRWTVDGNKKTSSSLPESLKAELISRSIYEVVEPFLSTEYFVHDAYKPITPPIYYLGISFGRWMAVWVRYLISLVKESPVANLFKACKAIIRTRVELCQFLLPYVIACIIRDKSAHEETNSIFYGIVQEICHVLRGRKSHEKVEIETAGASSIKLNVVSSMDQLKDDVDSNDINDSQISVQSIFSLLDRFSVWISEAKLQMQSDANPQPNKVSVTQSYIKPIQLLISNIPKELLGQAALSIKAYARALRYIETNAREVRYHTRSIETKDTVKPILALRKDYNDHANEILPIFDINSINQLMVIYANLEDSDSLRGVQVLKQIQGYHSDAWNRILEMEQSADWVGALVEYDILKSSEEYKQSYNILSHSNASQSSRNLNNPESNGQMINFQLQRKQSISVSLRVKDDEINAVKSLARIERGRLRCLLELGQLETMVDQVFDILYCFQSIII